MTQPKIYEKWPPQHPDRIQLYSVATPNGVKVSIALEEMGLPYEAHKISFADEEQHTEEYMSLSPNGKIPAIIDPKGPDGPWVPIMESGAILIYLAEKSGMLMPTDPIAKNECLQWMFFQVGHIGPMFGQFGHFYKSAVEKCKDPYPLERYKNETQRLLGVLETRLTGRDYILGSDYSIADIMIFPWIRPLHGFYDAADILELHTYPQVQSWFSRCLDRPAVQKGLTVPE